MRDLLDNYIEHVRLNRQQRSDNVTATEGYLKPFVGSDEGNKYHKVWYTLDGQDGQRSVHSFVNKVTGDIYSSKSWKQKGILIGNLEKYKQGDFISN
jgi:hypothetical protein